VIPPDRSERAPRNALQTLLAPLAVGEFLAEHYGRVACRLRGPADRFTFLDFGWATVERLLPVMDARGGLKIQFLDQAGRHVEVPIEGHQARALLEAGMTLCCAGLERMHAGLSGIAREVKLALSLAGPVGFNCYVSPPGKGFGLHFDSHEVMILQLEGKKRWWFSTRPAVAHPYANLVASSANIQLYQEAFPGADIRLPAREELEACILEPGDLLYLPAGCWHQAEAIERSTALTLALSSLSFHRLLVSVLARAYRRDGRMRDPIPPVSADELSLEGLPAVVERYLDEQLCEARRVLAGITGADLRQAWLEHVREPPVDDARTSALPAEPVGRRDGFEMRWSLVLTRSEGGDTVRVLGGGSALEMPRAALPFLRRLAATRTFVAGEAVAWSDDGSLLEWEEVQAALTVLRDGGLICPVPAVSR
jgi:hypothetical protein